MKPKKLTKVEKRAIDRQNGILNILFSSPSKMPCFTWSTLARVHCPGSRSRDELTGMMQLVAACKVCYAAAGHYRHESTKLVREFNAQEWEHSDFVDGFVAKLFGHMFFRWFDSGDLHSVQLAEKIYQIMLLSPKTLFWLPTRSWKLPKFKNVIDRMQKLANCVVRFSSDSITGKLAPTDNPQSIIYGNIDELTAVNGFQCKAYNGKNSDPQCGTCRACWSKDVPIVGYAGHGTSFAKAYKEELELESTQILRFAA